MFSALNEVLQRMDPAGPRLLDPAQVDEFARDVVALASTYTDAQAPGSSPGLGMDSLSKGLPVRLDKLLMSGNFDAGALKDDDLQPFYRALATLGAPAAARSCKLQLEARHAAHVNDFLTNLSKDPANAEAELTQAEAVSGKLALMHGLGKATREFEEFSRGLMNEALSRRYQALPASKPVANAVDGEPQQPTRAEVRTADAAALEALLPSREVQDEKSPLVQNADGGRPVVHRRFQSDLRTMLELVQAEPGTFERPGFQYTSWGTNHSLGTVVNTTLRYATLSTPARKFGNWVQGGRDSGPRYVAGAMIKGLASITGAASGVAGGLVSLAETVTKNVVEATVRLAFAGALGTAGLGARVVGIASPAAKERGEALLQRAKKVASRISFFSKGRQQQVSDVMAARAAELAVLARFTGTTTRSVRAAGLPGNFRFMDREHIPDSVLVKRASDEKATGKVAKMKFDEANGQLIGDWTNSLRIGAYTAASEGTRARACRRPGRSRRARSLSGADRHQGSCGLVAAQGGGAALGAGRARAGAR